MPFDDLLAFFSPTLDLPIGGKTYRVPVPDYKTGLRLTSWAALAAKAATPADLARLRLEDAAEDQFYRDALGATYDELVEDDVPYPALRHAGQTAFVWVTQDHCKGTTAAEGYWTSPGKAPTTGSPSTSSSTGEASTTPSRRRGSGTTSPRTSSPASKARKGAARPGPTS